MLPKPWPRVSKQPGRVICFGCQAGPFYPTIEILEKKHVNYFKTIMF